MTNIARLTAAPPVEGGKAPRKRRAGPYGDRGSRIAALTMSAFVLVPFAIFVVAPIVFMIAMSFTNWNGITAPGFVGIQNYVAMAGDTSWWRSVAVTLVFAAGKLLIEVPLALFLAVLLNSGIRGAGTYRSMYFLPHLLSISVMSIVFYFLLRPVNGVINDLLISLGMIGAPIDWLGQPGTALASVIAVGIWGGFGINTVLFLVALQTVPRDAIESARIDGANSLQVFRYVSLPALAPVGRVVVMLALVFTLRSFDLVQSLTQGGPAGSTDVMFTYLISYFFSFDRGQQFGYASALSVVASVIVTIVSLLYLRTTVSRKDRGQ